MNPKWTAGSEKSSQSTGSSTMPRDMSTELTSPLRPSTTRQTMVREAGLRKNGTIRSVNIVSLTRSERVPLASHSAKGKAMSSSIAVTVAAMRSERRITGHPAYSKMSS